MLKNEIKEGSITNDLKRKPKVSLGELIIEASRGGWEEAVIVFTQSSYSKRKPKISRSYIVFSNEDYFQSSKDDSSLFGDCLDGKDKRVPLDQYIHVKWTVDYCYIVK